MFSVQLCQTLCDPLDYSPPSSSLRRIFPAITPAWIAASFSRRSSQPRDQPTSPASSVLQEDFFFFLLLRQRKSPIKGDDIWQLEGEKNLTLFVYKVHRCVECIGKHTVYL